MITESNINDKVSDFLKELANIRIKKNKEYMDDKNNPCYRKHGAMMKVLFPNGMDLVEQKDFDRYAILDMIIGKIIRYCNNFNKNGHEDSLIDLAIYSQMLREIDNE